MYCRDCKHYDYGRCEIHGINPKPHSSTCRWFAECVAGYVRLKAVVHIMSGVYAPAAEYRKLQVAGYKENDKVWLDISPRGKDD